MAKVLIRDQIKPPYQFFSRAGRSYPRAIETRAVYDAGTRQIALFINMQTQNVPVSLLAPTFARIEAEYEDATLENLIYEANPFLTGVIHGGWRRIDKTSNWAQGNIIGIARPPDTNYRFASDDFTLQAGRVLKQINWYWKER